MWGRSPTTPNREIFRSMNFQNFDLKAHRDFCIDIDKLIKVTL
jgi:hypothetical protein